MPSKRTCDICNDLSYSADSWALTAELLKQIDAGEKTDKLKGQITIQRIRARTKKIQNSKDASKTA